MWAIIRFPGSNCDRDCLDVCRRVLGVPAELVDYRTGDLKRFELVILPGGFSYGDYVRAGALARIAPAVRALVQFAGEGRPVLGICNGFQILLEAGLLPGAMLVNDHLEFRCQWVHLKCENRRTPFTRDCPSVLAMPIAHKEGRYFLPPDELARLEDGGQVVFRYCDASGRPLPESNPNGSVNNIAGICNAAGNVLGLMPHPERASEAALGGTDGRTLFESALAHLAPSR
ncbi:MAG: phosphoribosylformylglycinamidine synthase subunit PurQ [Candidatus Sumerlaeia bacterium]